MSRHRAPVLTEDDLGGFRFWRPLRTLLRRYHDHATARDTAGNRQLHCDAYVSLLLLYFFTPLLTSLRGLAQATTFQRVQQALGVAPTARSTLSEAARVFDPALLREVLAEVATQALRQSATPPDERPLWQELHAVDGTLLPALPRMVWALWQDAQHRAAKLHLVFAVHQQTPVAATVTTGNGAERDQLRQLVQPGGFYVLDRGYTDYALFQELHDRPCRFVARLRGHAAYQVQESRPLPADAHAVGITQDVILARVGSDHHKKVVHVPLRLVRVIAPSGDAVLLLTNCLDLPATDIALAYRYRWRIELFFRWLKCLLGCRHLLHQNLEGVTLQVYVALIASAWLSLWLGRQPCKRVWEALCWYTSGWASADELLAVIDREHPKTPPPSKK